MRKRLAGAMALGLCISLGLLVWTGYQIIGEGELSLRLLAERRAQDAAAIDRPDHSDQTFIAQALVKEDPILVAAILFHRRVLLMATSGSIAFAVGLLWALSAVRAQAELAERRSEFVSSVTHELKNPVAAIRAAAETLLSGRVTAPAASREYAQLVVDQARRLTRLLDNLLAYSRITDVTDVYDFQPIAIKGVVDQTLRDFRSQLETAGFETDVQIPAALPPVRADRTAIGLMLDNLVDNAVRYSPDTRWIRISAIQGNAVVTLEVADRGIGIPEDEIAKVTAKFFRGQRAQSSGSGLGLAIAARILEDHGGALNLRSRPNEGTSVRATLPIWQNDETPHSER